MQFIHRSVGEPAEGSLTRYPYVNQSRTCFHPPFTENERSCVQATERDCLGSLLVRTTFALQKCVRRRCISSWRSILARARLSWELVGVPYSPISPFLLVDFYMLDVSCLVHAIHTFTYLNVKFTTLSNGYLGSRNDEERSEMRYVMRIAEFSESSNLWTQIALLGSPRSTPLSVSVHPSLSSVFAALGRFRLRSGLSVWPNACWLDNESPCAFVMRSLEIHGVQHQLLNSAWDTSKIRLVCVIQLASLWLLFDSDVNIGLLVFLFTCIYWMTPKWDVLCERSKI